MKQRLLSVILLEILFAGYLCAAEIISLNRGWRFRKGTELRTMRDGEAVDLPHTWNAADAMFGNTQYYRGMATYSRELHIPSAQGKRYFLRVNAAQSVAAVFVDNRFVTEHRGGYTAFTVELTGFVTPGRTHKLDIRVSNAATTDVAPLSGDFNIYGGLHRGVDLIVTEAVCIRPDYYASPGVFFTQREVSGQQARLEMEALLSAAEGAGFDGCEVEFLLQDATGKTVCRSVVSEIAPEGNVKTAFAVEKPRLWQGVDDPYLYRGIVVLRKDGVELDRREEPVGFRFYRADPDQGFLLNGKPYRLLGANLHQDRAERGAACLPEDFDEDLDLAQEMGCNSLRLAHYPHSQEVYRRMDERGLVAWTEIPFVNIYIDNPAYAENLRQQLRELVLQNYNHPCVLAWGLFNEVNSGWMENVTPMVAELNELAHRLDSSRPTVGATNQNEEFNGFPDYIAHNKYFGWYGAEPEEMGVWMAREHAAHPRRPMGISEYGAGGNVTQQQDSLAHPEPWGQWHPENWQTYYHMENWRILQAAPYLWCTYIWNLCDFTAAGRREGNTPGRNDKGLVSYDRKVKKDAFYFYKANWNRQEKFLYIAARRHTVRREGVTDIQVFGNCGEAELFLNGRSLGRRTPDEVSVLTWKDVALQEGENLIEVRNRQAKDECRWTFVSQGKYN